MTSLAGYTHPSAAAEIIAWRERLRWTQLILLVSTAASREQFYVVDKVKEAYPDTSLLHQSDCGAQSAWQLILAKQLTDRFADDIYNDLITKAQDQGLTVVCPHIVKQFVTVAPSCLTVQQVCELINRDRIGLWAELKKGGLANPKHLLTAVRVLYLFKLRELGWSPRASQCISAATAASISAAV